MSTSRQPTHPIQARDGTCHRRVTILHISCRLEWRARHKNNSAYPAKKAALRRPQNHLSIPDSLHKCDLPERSCQIVAWTSREKQLIRRAIRCTSTSKINAPELINLDIDSVHILYRTHQLSRQQVERIDGRVLVDVVRDQQRIAQRPEIIAIPCPLC